MPVHATNDGCRLSYTIAGAASAPPLVLCNSLGTDRGLWEAQIEAFAASFRVISHDTRGHGASDAPAGDYALARLGADVLSLMDAEGVARAHVCGVSVGGLTALWLGVHAPARVGRLVLANTAARIGSVELWNTRMRTAASDGLESLAEASMARWFTPAYRHAAPATIARLRAAFCRVPVAGYRGCCAALRDADLSAAVARVVAPTVVIIGTHDPATPPDAGRWLARTIPGAALVELDAAHLSNVERAPEFTEAVATFLRG